MRFIYYYDITEPCQLNSKYWINYVTKKLPYGVIDFIYDQNILFGACERGDINLVKLTLLKKKTPDFLLQGLLGACKGGHLEIVNLIIKEIDDMDDTVFGSNKYISNGLYEACFGGNIDIINIIIEKGSYISQRGLQGACAGGHLAIIELMLQKVEADCSSVKYCGKRRDCEERCSYNCDWRWNYGLLGACEGGHLAIINLMIEKGADDWNDGLIGACLGGHIDIVNLMIEKGATRLDSGINVACSKGHQELLKFLLEKYYLDMGINYTEILFKIPKDNINDIYTSLLNIFPDELIDLILKRMIVSDFNLKEWLECQ